MEVDDEDGTQRPRRVNDYGIEVDFDSLDEDQREVPPFCVLSSSCDSLVFRTHLQKPAPNSMYQSLR